MTAIFWWFQRRNVLKPKGAARAGFPLWATLSIMATGLLVDVTGGILYYFNIPGFETYVSGIAALVQGEHVFQRYAIASSLVWFLGW